MSTVGLENFYDEAKMFMLSRAKNQHGTHGHIVEDVASDEAKAWLAYAKRKGWGLRERTWAHILKTGGKLTMPCRDPESFDPAPRGYRAREAAE